MGLKEIIKRAFMEGYATSDITLVTVALCLICTVCIALYIYIIYKQLNKNSFYNKGFNMSLVVIAIVTAAIIVTIQSNIVVSLGMVGALSIVRFRTAIKDPMDLCFLFWSISAGIICGAGFALIAVLASIVISIILILLSKKQRKDGTLLLVVNSQAHVNEKEISEKINELCDYSRIRARNASRDGLNLAIEVQPKDAYQLIDELLKFDFVKNASLVESDGNITA